MRERMIASGHFFFTPMHAGLGERSDLAGTQIDLELHIRDIQNVLEFEDLHDFILVGHSYGGMVATGVAVRSSDRIRVVVLADVRDEITRTLE